MRDWSGFTVHDPRTHMKVGRTYKRRASAVRRARTLYPVGQVATVQQWDAAAAPVRHWFIEGRAERCR